MHRQCTVLPERTHWGFPPDRTSWPNVLGWGKSGRLWDSKKNTLTSDTQNYRSLLKTARLLWRTHRTYLWQDQLQKSSRPFHCHRISCSRQLETPEWYHLIGQHQTQLQISIGLDTKIKTWTLYQGVYILRLPTKAECLEQFLTMHWVENIAYVHQCKGDELEAGVKKIACWAC